MEFIDLLFEELTEVTGLEDIGFHKLEDGRLKPIHKTNTDVLGIEKWKKTHNENPVFINETKVLLEIINTKRPVFINNTKTDTLSADAFFLFGVDSVAIFPVLRAEKVLGIVCVVSIGTLHEFGIQEVSKCESLVNKYNGQLLCIL